MAGRLTQTHQRVAQLRERAEALRDEFEAVMPTIHWELADRGNSFARSWVFAREGLGDAAVYLRRVEGALAGLSPRTEEMAMADDVEGDDDARVSAEPTGDGHDDVAPP
jgi:hypothetical protein